MQKNLSIILCEILRSEGVDIADKIDIFYSFIKWLFVIIDWKNILVVISKVDGTPIIQKHNTNAEKKETKKKLRF